LTRLFRQSDRRERTTGETKEEGTKMKKFGFAAMIASGLTAAVLGLAGPATADVGHHDWVNTVQPSVSVPSVDTSVHHSH
jgi:hypothetical protein